MTDKKRLKQKITVRRRDIIALCLIFVLCAAVFGWAATAFLPDAQQQFRREIVNDDYDSLTAPLEPGGVVSQSITAEGRLYGVRVRVHTYNAVVHGSLHLRLLDESGAQLGGCVTDMTKLLDDTFHLFLFDDMIDAGEGQRYTLEFEAAEADGPVALYKSSGAAQDYLPHDEEGVLTGEAPHYPLAGFALSEDGEAQAGTLALQYVTRYAGGFIVVAYWFFAALLTVLLLAVYTLVFIVKWPLHRIFVVCALGLGLVLMFLIPPRTAPDEYAHIATAYQYGNVLLGQGDAPLLTVRAGDEMYLANYDFDATDVFAYQELYEGLFSRAPEGETLQVQARTVPSFPLMHLPQTLGVLLARLLGLGLVPLLLLGRLGNLIFYMVLVSRAVKRMPFAKPLLFCAALLPSCLQLAASFCYDTYVIALAFYLLASCLELVQVYGGAGTKPVGWPRLIGVGATAVLLAPGKAVYVLLVGLLLFIPLAAYKSKKARRVFLGGVALCAAALWVWGNWGQVRGNLAGVLGSYVAPLTAEESDAQAGANLSLDAKEWVLTSAMAGADNGVLRQTSASAMVAQEEAPAPEWSHSSELFSPLYVLQNLPQTLKMLAASLWEQSPVWLQGLLGGRLGEIIAIDLSANWLFTIGLLLVLLMVAIPDSEDRHVLAKKQRWGLAGMAAGVAALLLAICVMWTPTDYETLFGFQGRYLLPVLPLVLLALRGHSLQWKKPVWRGAVVAMPVLVGLVCLDVFGVVVGR